MAFISSDFFISYNVISTFSSDFWISYGINRWIAANKLLSYSISEIMSKDVLLTYDLDKTYIYNDFQLNYGLQVVNDIEISFDMPEVDGMIVMSCRLLYDLKYTPYTESLLVNDILDHNKVYRDFGLSYHLYWGGHETVEYSYLQD